MPIYKAILKAGKRRQREKEKELKRKGSENEGKERRRKKKGSQSKGKGRVGMTREGKGGRRKGIVGKDFDYMPFED